MVRSKQTKHSHKCAKQLDPVVENSELLCATCGRHITNPQTLSDTSVLCLVCRQTRNRVEIQDEERTDYNTFVHAERPDFDVHSAAVQ